jgi:predicted P-loop ATPase
VVDINRTKSLGRLRELVSADIKLKKNGKEWVGLCPFHADRKPSLTIFTGSDGHERYHCFSCQAHGDVLDYIMETRGVSLKEADLIIAGEDTSPSGGKQRQRKPIEPHDPYEDVTPVVPIPKGTVAIKIGEPLQVWNPKRERYTRYRPSATHLYRDADGAAMGYVLRQDMPDGRKITPMIMLCHREGKTEPEWSHYTFARPRQMYGLNRIAKKKQIVIVEGEKTADAGYELLGPTTAVVSWAGGALASRHTDWSLLEDRDVIIVPDADEAGREASTDVARLADAAGAKRIRVVDTSEMEAEKKGWDLADVEGWDRAQTLTWLSERATGWADGAPEEPEPAPPGEGALGTDVATAAPDLADTLIWNQDGTPKASSQHNYITYLLLHPDLANIFAFNEFSLEITLTRCPPWEKEKDFTPRSLNDEDVTFCQGALEHYGLSPRHDATRKAIIASASKRAFHPAREFFDELKSRWDGEKRLDNWLSYYLGVKPTDYSSLVGRKWLIAAVRRVYQPGCKFDSMLILEGPQNIGKSFALRALATFNGVSYFTDGVKNIQKKEAAMTMHGCLIVELAELDALNKAETTQIKSWITQQEDHYRPPYGATIRRAPRQCVLSGTVNPEGGYLKDSTGNRRFWPVWCSSVDIPAIEHDRDQLWAEAVLAHETGEPLYLRGDEIKTANAAQEDRYQDDVWAADIDGYVSGREATTIREILAEPLGIPAERRNQQQERRVIRHLTNRGWTRVKQLIPDPASLGDTKTEWVYVAPQNGSNADA